MKRAGGPGLRLIGGTGAGDNCDCGEFAGPHIWDVSGAHLRLVITHDVLVQLPKDLGQKTEAGASTKGHLVAKLRRCCYGPRDASQGFEAHLEGSWWARGSSSGSTARAWRTWTGRSTLGEYISSGMGTTTSRSAYCRPGSGRRESFRRSSSSSCAGSWVRTRGASTAGSGPAANPPHLGGVRGGSRTRADRHRGGPAPHGGAGGGPRPRAREVQQGGHAVCATDARREEVFPASWETDIRLRRSTTMRLAYLPGTDPTSREEVGSPPRRGWSSSWAATVRGA